MYTEHPAGEIPERDRQTDETCPCCVRADNGGRPSAVCCGRLTSCDLLSPTPFLLLLHPLPHPAGCGGGPPLALPPSSLHPPYHLPPSVSSWRRPCLRRPPEAAALLLLLLLLFLPGSPAAPSRSSTPDLAPLLPPSPAPGSREVTTTQRGREWCRCWVG